MAEFEFRADLKNSKTYVIASSLREITERSIRHGFFALGQDLRRVANKEILFKPKSGRTYIRRDKAGRKRKHVASAPGETHANMTGRLRKSLGWKVYGHKSMEFGYGVSTIVPAPEYAGAMEFGNRRVAARPSLQNAINDTNRNATVYFTERFGK